MMNFSDSNVKSYTDYKKMIKENQLDVIAVATESGNHPEIVIESLEKNINVISEKPMALSIKECDQIIEVEKKSGKKVTNMCLQNRYNQPVQKLKNAVLQGRFGKIYHGQISDPLE